MFNYNFVRNTSRFVNYRRSDNYRTFLLSAIKAVKIADLAAGVSDNELHKRGRQAKKSQGQNTVNKPRNGTEFYFSNCLIKIY